MKKRLFKRRDSITSESLLYWGCKQYKSQ